MGSKARILLKTVSYDVEIRSFASRITIDQTYVNNEQIELECVYTFPIHDKASVIGFQVSIDGRTLTSQFKKKDEAFQEYNGALAGRFGAYLLNRNDDRDDIFVMSVGRLPPGKECTVTINYVSTLESVDQTNLRLTIPLAVIPRYIDIHPSQQIPLETDSLLPSTTICQLNAIVEMNEAIKSVTSPTHPIQVDTHEPKRAKVTFETEKQLDKDFILNIEVKSNPEHLVEVEEYAPNKFAAMYSFIPDNSQLDRDIVYELVFLVDCSCSMASDNKIANARTAMQAFLRSLPKTCFFNFYKFGSGFTSLFPESTAYNETSFKMAKKYVSAVQADMGGTNLYEPLQSIFSERMKGRQRIVFVLADGGVCDPARIIDLVRRNAQNNRVFSFGIGCYMSTDLINGLANAGNGKAEILNTRSDLSSLVCLHLRGALQPAISEATVTLDGSLRNVQLVPAKLPVIFAGKQATVFALFEKDPFSPTPKVAFLLKTKASRVKVVVSLEDPKSSADNFISKLAARAVIKELESRTVPDSETITKLSLEFGVVSKYVSLIAIEKRGDAELTDTELREIPVKQASSKSLNQGSYWNPDIMDRENIRKVSARLNDLEDVGYDLRVKFRCRCGVECGSSLSTLERIAAKNKRADLILKKATGRPVVPKSNIGEKMMGALGRIRNTAGKLLQLTRPGDKRSPMVKTTEIQAGSSSKNRCGHDSESEDLVDTEWTNYKLSTGSPTDRAKRDSQNSRVGSLENILLLQKWDGSWNMDGSLEKEMPES